MSFARCDFDDSSWESVTVPHDWAIYGPFDRENDLQDVLVAQNLETRPTLKTGRTGGLPYIGTGWYRRMIDTGIEARVYVNGTEVIFWPYGYNSFWCDITDALHTDGTSDVLAVRLENRPNSSRWYPGAGLYRNVHLLTVSDSHIPVWGTYITTPEVTSGRASVHVETQVPTVICSPLRSLPLQVSLWPRILRSDRPGYGRRKLLFCTRRYPGFSTDRFWLTDMRLFSVSAA